MRHQAEIWSKVILFINEKQCPPYFYKKIVGGNEGGLNLGGGGYTINGVQTTF